MANLKNKQFQLTTGGFFAALLLAVAFPCGMMLTSSDFFETPPTLADDDALAADADELLSPDFLLPPLQRIKIRGEKTISGMNDS